MIGRLSSSPQHLQPPLAGGISLPGGKIELKVDGTGITACDAGIVVSPKPGFVIKTQILSASCEAKKLFINLCSDESVSKPGKTKKLDEKGNELEGLNVPVSVGPIRRSQDKVGKPCHTIDCIVNPGVIEEMKNDSSCSHRDFICRVLIQCVEGKFKELSPIDRRYKLPNLIYHGYVHSKTGESVSKASEHAEVAKQLVRDVSKRPTIREVPTEVKRALVAGPSSASRHEPKQCLPIELGIEVAGGHTLLLSDFIDDWNKLVKGTLHFRVSPQFFENKQEKLSLSQCLEQPLLYDPDDHSNTPTSQIMEELCAKKIIGTAKVNREFVDEVQVEVSATVLEVSIPGFLRTECVLPLCAVPSTAKCTFIEDTSNLHFEVCVSEQSMADGADIGSNPWTLARGLGSAGSERVAGKKNSKQRRKQTSKNLPNEANSINPPQNDLFQLTSPGTTSNELPDSEDAALPEDAFHAQDTMSQHVMEQQEEERKEKMRKNQYKREASAVDSDVEYMSVDDFKPGGKYYDLKLAGTNKEELESLEHVNSQTDLGPRMNKAKGMVRKGGPAMLSNSVWSDFV